MGCFDHLSTPFQILFLVFDARRELLGANFAMLRQVRFLAHGSLRMCYSVIF
jgi:hypothetical protein